MRRLRVLVLMHEELVPPEDRSERGSAIPPWRTEHDVLTALSELGHDVRECGVHDDLDVLRSALDGHDPHVTFNVLEEFHGVATYPQAVIGWLELVRRATTGCNARGMLLAHDKLLTKSVLEWHGIPTPRCAAFPLGGPPRRPRDLRFPLVVKSIDEEASLGISRASVVQDEARLAERVAYMHGTFGTGVLAEEYVEGRELYVGLIGNSRVEVLPTWELSFDDWPDGAPRIATERVKWDAEYQKRRGIRSGRAGDLPPDVAREIERTCRRAYRALGLSGYARIDLRLDSAGKLWVLEANANPDLARDEDFAQSALAAGLAYPALIQRILNLALAWRPKWRDGIPARSAAAR
jgi:D-alanine-D-alanine ligase